MKINVTRSSMPSYEEYCGEIKSLWDTRHITNSGAKHIELENLLKSYLGIDSIALFANGHLALENLIDAMEFKEGDEVITTPFTFASTVHAIKRCRLRPVFCDISKDDLCIDSSKIESLITDKTAAILPVHVYGNMCDHENISKIANKYSLKLIYDAAHAFGAFYKGKAVASYGDAAMLSFHATKVFHTIEGGAVCTIDKSIIKRINELKNFGLTPDGDCNYAGGNSKLSEFHAAMGICNLRHIDAEIKKRKNAVEYYRKHLKNINGIRLITPNAELSENYAYMPIIAQGGANARERILNNLAESSIFARKYFSPAINDMAVYRNDAQPTPIAHKISESVICLPLYADIDTTALNKICQIIKASL